jgi:hypothetical protein
MSNGVETNIPQIEQQYTDIANYYDFVVPREFQKLARSVLSQLRAGKFKNNTGALRRSMRTEAFDTGVGVEMLNYGYFLSFGVNGKNRKKAFGLTEGVAGAFSVTEGYKFGNSSDKVYDIAPRKFYPMDLEQKIIDILLNKD